MTFAEAVEAYLTPENPNEQYLPRRELHWGVGL